MPIIAFSQDWWSEPSANHHVLRELAKTRRVVWLSSIGTRDASAIGTIRRKLVEFAHGPRNVEHDLWVVTPLVLPLARSPAARAVNRWLLDGYVRAVRMRLGIDRFQLWTFLPTVADYLGTLGEDLSVYCRVDPPERGETVDAERRLLARVDAVFATSGGLVAATQARCANTFWMPHGVDHARFARALDPATEIPAELAALPGPRIGFHGTERDWIDYDLVAHIARSRPAWSLVLIGPVVADAAKLRGLANVHVLGKRAHADLPAYCKGLDVGIIPYVTEERMAFVSPLELREYLAAGLPVVATRIPEVERYAHLCHLADRDTFVAAIERALHETGPLARAARSRAMQDETWSARIADVARRMDQLAACKGGLP